MSEFTRVGMAALATALASAPALAQEANDTSESSLQEIVVTAQKRSEILQKVPLSVSALSAEDLQKRGLSALSGLATQPPVGTFIQNFSGNPTVLVVDIRGIGNSDPSQGTGESVTGVYIDDVYLGRGQGIGAEIADPERIEVLRGPQGTLFGRNAQAGVVRIVSKRPTGKLGGTVSGTVGNFGTAKVAAHINLPEVAGFRAKVDYLNKHIDGFTKNPRLASIDSQTDFGYEQAEAYRIAVEYVGIDKLTASYIYDHQVDTAGVAYTMLDCASAPASFTARGICNTSLGGSSPRPNDNISTFTRTSWLPLYIQPHKLVSWGHNLRLEYDLADQISIKSISAYRKLRYAGGGSLNGAFVFQRSPFTSAGVPASSLNPTLGSTTTGLPANATVYAYGGTVPYANIDQKQFSQELQLVGTSGELQYTLGGYYFREDVTDTRQTAFTIAAISPDLTQVVPTNPFGLPFPGQGPTSQKGKTTSYAAFGQLTWTPGFAQERLHLTAGLRYTNDRKEFARVLSGGSVTNIVPAPFTQSRVDPAFAVAFDAAPNVNVYARYAQAYRSGGVSVRSKNFQPYGAEQVKSLEFGVKSELLDRHLRLNVAAYENRWINRQVGVQTNLANPAETDIINIPGTTRIRGIETEVEVVPFAGLRLSGTYAYAEARQPKFVIPTDPNATFTVTNVPKHSVTAAADYTLDRFSFGQLVLHGDYAYAPKYACAVRVSLGGYAYPCRRDVANARVSLQDIPVGGARLKISGYVNNLFDVTYPVYVTPQANYWALEPRRYGVEVQLSF